VTVGMVTVGTGYDMNGMYLNGGPVLAKRLAELLRMIPEA